MRFSPIPFLALAVFAGGCADTIPEATPAKAAEPARVDLALAPPPPMDPVAKDFHADYVARVVVVSVPGIKSEDVQRFFGEVRDVSGAKADFFRELAAKYPGARFLYTGPFELTRPGVAMPGVFYWRDGDKDIPTSFDVTATFPEWSGRSGGGIGYGIKLESTRPLMASLGG